MLQYWLCSGTKPIQDCQSQQLQQALETIRTTSFYETRKRGVFAPNCKIKATFLISCAHESLAEKMWFLHLCFDSASGRIASYCRNPAEPWNGHRPANIQRPSTPETRFAACVSAGERGMGSFPLLPRRNAVSITPQAHQLPNGAGKIKQTEVMLHQISPSRSRQVSEHGRDLEIPALGPRTTRARHGGERILQST